MKAKNFGELHAEGQSKIWEAKLSIPNLGDDFLVRIWGTKEGPTESQCEFFGKLTANAKNIQEAASAPIADYLHSCAVVPDGVNLNFENAWSYLTAAFIEVQDGNEYSAGEGAVGTIAICIGYNIPWEPEHLLQLAVIDGKLDQIYSE